MLPLLAHCRGAFVLVKLITLLLAWHRRCALLMGYEVSL